MPGSGDLLTHTWSPIPVDAGADAGEGEGADALYTCFWINTCSPNSAGARAGAVATGAAFFGGENIWSPKPAGAGAGASAGVDGGVDADPDGKLQD